MANLSDALSNNLVPIVESSSERSTFDDAERVLLVDQTSENSNSQALKVAIEVGDLILCTRLVSDGVNLNNSFGCCLKCNPLLYSLHYRQPAIAHLLVENGAKRSAITCACWDTHGYDAIQYAASLGYSELLELLLEKSPKPRPRSAVDPIHLAAAGEHLDCLRLLLDHDLALGEPPFSGTSEIESSYHIDSKVNGSQRERFKEAYGSDISDDHALLKLVDVRIQNHLLDHPWRLNDQSTSSAPFESATALHIVSCVGNVKIADLLLQRGADIEACNADEKTALHLAVFDDRRDVVQLLLDTGANVNCRDKEGRTPAMFASKHGDLEILDILREHKADFSARDSKGWDCLHHATWHKQVLVLPGLIALGQDLTSANIFGVSALHHALMAQSTDIERFCMDYATINEASGSYLGNVLNVASALASLAVVHWILKRMPEGKEHAFINFRSIVFSSPLIAAVYRGHSGIVEALLDAGADVELSDGQFGSPLMTACALGRLKVVKLFVKRGAILTYSKDGTLAAMTIAAHHKKVQDWLRLFEIGKPVASLCMGDGSRIVEEVDA